MNTGTHYVCKEGEWLIDRVIVSSTDERSMGAQRDPSGLSKYRGRNTQSAAVALRVL